MVHLKVGHIAHLQIVLAGGCYFGLGMEEWKWRGRLADVLGARTKDGHM